MTGPARRYWRSLSPALRRYYLASVAPTLLFLGAMLLHQAIVERSGMPAALRWGAALAPVAALAWTFGLYLRFLRECDELELRIEVTAVALGAGVAMLAALAAMLLLDARLLCMEARDVAAWMFVLLVASYAVVRGVLHRRYA